MSGREESKLTQVSGWGSLVRGITATWGKLSLWGQVCVWWGEWDREGIRLNSFIFYFILFYFWLHWVFIAARGLSLVAASGPTLCCGARASHCGGFSCCRAWALGARASEVAAHRLGSCGSQALERRLSSCGAQG